jgi:hypothetical protein
MASWLVFLLTGTQPGTFVTSFFASIGSILTYIGLDLVGRLL